MVLDDVSVYFVGDGLRLEVGSWRSTRALSLAGKRHLSCQPCELAATTEGANQHGAAGPPNIFISASLEFIFFFMSRL